MSPAPFWDRDLDQTPRPVNTSGIAPVWGSPENAPNPEDLDPRCRPWHPCDGPPDFAFDAARDELLTGEDIFSDEWPHQIKHPTEHLLQTVVPASYPAGPAAAAPDASPPSPRASGAAASFAKTSGARKHPDAA